MKKSDIRKFMKLEFGLKCRIVSHPMIDAGVVIEIPEIGIGTANIFSRKTYEENSIVIEYVEKLKGAILDSGERII